MAGRPQCLFLAHRDGRRFDGQPSLSRHCGHEAIFGTRRSVANYPIQTSAGLGERSFLERHPAGRFARITLALFAVSSTMSVNSASARCHSVGCQRGVACRRRCAMAANRTDPKPAMAAKRRRLCSRGIGRGDDGCHQDRRGSVAPIGRRSCLPAVLSDSASISVSPQVSSARRAVPADAMHCMSEAEAAATRTLGH